jgi:hypothetical protein
MFDFEQFRLGSPKYKYEKGEFVLNSSFNTIQRNYNTFNSYSNSWITVIINREVSMWMHSTNILLATNFVVRAVSIP